MDAKEIAVRIYENKKFGNTYAKGCYHSAVFNASADIVGENIKYLLDYYPFEKFEHIASSEEQLDVLREIGRVNTDDTLFSWVVRYDPVTKNKTPAYGLSTFNLRSNIVRLAVGEGNDGEGHHWTLTAKPCRRVSGKNSPNLLATNADLGA